MEKTWAASYPLLTQKAFLPLIGWILLLMKGQIHNVEDQSSWYCHFVPVLKCFKINMGCMTKKRGPNKNHRVQKVKNMVHKIQHGVYDTTGPYKHRAVLIWQVTVFRVTLYHSCQGHFCNKGLQNAQSNRFGYHVFAVKATHSKNS